MILLDDLGKYIKGRLWLNDIPNSNYEIIETLEKDAIIKENVNIKTRMLALELRFPRHSSNYAFLGAIYDSNDSSSLKIKVNIGSENGILFDTSIVSRPDVAYVGITKEYADSIINSAKEYVEENGFQQGTLIFNSGAYGEIGSSNMFFSKITKIVLYLMKENFNDYSAEKINELVRNQL